LCAAREAPVIKMESFQDNDLLDLFRGIEAHDILSPSRQHEVDQSVKCIWTGMTMEPSQPMMLKKVLLLSRNEAPSFLDLPNISFPVS
jgi:hypothetical protein